MLTKSEEAIVQGLRQVKVATMEQLRQRFQVSHMTVVRALNEYGYFSSYNHNGKFYVLRDSSIYPPSRIVLGRNGKSGGNCRWPPLGRAAWACP